MAKYNSIITEYKENKYQSRKEARYAFELDVRIKLGEVKSWERQFKLPIIINDTHICNYIVDFRVVLSDGSVSFVEIKGFSTAIFKLKYKLAQVLYPNLTFVLVK